jgi:hypothetical protein
MMQFLKKKLEEKTIIIEIFYSLVLLTSALIILEIIFPRIVLVYFNLNYLILITLFLSILVLIKNK